MIAAFAVILAHQGGWDELLMVAVPVVLVAGLLLLANKRAKQALAAQAAERAVPSPDPTSPDAAAPAAERTAPGSEHHGEPGPTPPVG